jgi:hypothetical protein
MGHRLDLLDELLQKMAVQVASRPAVLYRNVPVRQGEQTRSEDIGEMLSIKSV